MNTIACLARWASSPPVRDRTCPRATACTTAAGARTSRLASANCGPPTTRTRRVCRPGSVPTGTVTVMRKRPEASATVVPSCTGSLRSSAASGAPGGYPLPAMVTGSPGAASSRSVVIVGPAGVVDVVALCWVPGARAGVVVVVAGGAVVAVPWVGAGEVVVVVEVLDVDELDVELDVVDVDASRVVEVVELEVVELDASTVVEVVELEVDVELVVELDVDDEVVPVGTVDEVVEVLVVLDVDVVDVDVDVGATVELVVVDVGGTVVEVEVVVDVELDVVVVGGTVVEVVVVVPPVIVTVFTGEHANELGSWLASPL